MCKKLTITVCGSEVVDGSFIMTPTHQHNGEWTFGPTDNTDKYNAIEVIFVPDDNGQTNGHAKITLEMPSDEHSWKFLNNPILALNDPEYDIKHYRTSETKIHISVYRRDNQDELNAYILFFGSYLDENDVRMETYSDPTLTIRKLP